MTSPIGINNRFTASGDYFGEEACELFNEFYQQAEEENKSVHMTPVITPFPSRAPNFKVSFRPFRINVSTMECHRTPTGLTSRSDAFIAGSHWLFKDNSLSHTNARNFKVTRRGPDAIIAFDYWLVSKKRK